MTRLRPAELLLQDLGITEPREIDLEAIAWTQGVHVRYRPLDGCEARIIGCGDRAIITVNDRSSARRQRFSIGHELGHWKWHRGRILVCRADEIDGGDSRRPQIERAADSFAADLLMPGFLLRPICTSFPKLTFKTVSAIADAFDVSLTAAAIRLVEIEHSPSLLVCHGPPGRKWFTRSPSVPDHWFPQNELDHESIAFDILFGSQSDDRSPHRIGADAWFDCRGADGHELTEETVRTGPHEVLTLLVLTDAGMLQERVQHRGGRW